MIEASRCPSCERVAAPPEPRCLACRQETEATGVPAEGRVLTYVPVEEAWVALVELQGGARLLAGSGSEPEVEAQVSIVEDPGGRFEIEA